METNLLKIERDKQTPKAVLKRLMEGNKQFANSKKFTDQNFDLQIRQTAVG